MKRIAVWLWLASGAVFSSSGLSSELQGQSYLNLPLAFEANHGQSDARVRYLAHGAGYALYLTSNEAVLSLPQAGREALPLGLRLLDANPAARVEGDRPLPGKSNYFRGNDPSHWLTNIPHYGRVRYRDVYPGIDLIYYGSQSGRLEYDFV